MIVVMSMKCPNCGIDLTNNYCMKCGYMIGDHKINNKIDDTDLLCDYLGIKYAKFKDVRFNIPAFFFGPYYLAYRKFYSLSFKMAIGDIILGFAYFYFINLQIGQPLRSSSKYLIYLFVLGRNLILGWFFNTCYLRYSKRQIEQLNQTEIKFGKRTDLFYAIVLPLMQIIILVFVFVIYMLVKGKW